MWRVISSVFLALSVGSPSPAKPQSQGEEIARYATEEVRRFTAREARQGVATSADRLYAVNNSELAAYDRDTGARLAHWQGDPAWFPHLNSCTVITDELICANSNYPAVPMASSIETFDAETLAHKDSHSLGPLEGSLTWLVRHEGSWWATFANYLGKGGQPLRDHRATVLVRMDDTFTPQERWLFPESVVAEFAPYSSSGGDWGEDGLLYVTGHDRPEVYVLALPPAGPVLRHVATLSVSTEGQAIAWDREDPRLLWSIDRSTQEVVASRVPAIGG